MAKCLDGLHTPRREEPTIMRDRSLMHGLVLLVVAALAPARSPAVDAADCHLKLLGSIDLTITDDLVRVPVTLNGRSASMVLDIGSGASVFWKRTPDEWRLRRTGQGAPTEAPDLGSSVLVDGSYTVAFFDSLALGTSNVGGGAFLVAPALPPRVSDTGPNATIGLLGFDVFRHVDFELDLANRKLNLFSQDHCPGNVVYWSDTAAYVPLRRSRFGDLYFPVVLEGKVMEATFSPSEPFTTVTTDTTQRLYGFDASSPGVQEERDGDGTAHRFRAMQLATRGLKVMNTKIALIPPPGRTCRLTVNSNNYGGATYRPSCKQFPIKLGRNVLQDLRLFFAFSESRLYFTAAEKKKQPE